MSHWFDQLAQDAARRAASSAPVEGGAARGPAALDATAKSINVDRLVVSRFPRRHAFRLALGASAAVAAGSMRGLISPAPARAADCFNECKPGDRSCRSASYTTFTKDRALCFLPVPTSTDIVDLTVFLLGQVVKKAAVPLTLECLGQAGYDQEVREFACDDGFRRCLTDCSKPPMPPPSACQESSCTQAGGLCCGPYTVVRPNGSCDVNCSACLNPYCETCDGPTGNC